VDYSLVKRPRHAVAMATAAWGLAITCPASAAGDAAVLAQLQRLLERVGQLEQRNAQLEDQVRELKAGLRPASVTVPVATQSAAPSAEGRLTTLEAQVQAMARPPELETDDGPGLVVEGGVLAVGQRVNRGGSVSGQGESRLNWRGDVEVSMPLGDVLMLGDAQLTGFGHLRFGQGTGVALRPTHSATANSVPFEAGAGSDETYAIVAQAWGQLTWPLEASGFNDLPGSRVELNLGKMDVFGFFDQNAVAGDEGAQFLNNLFVHNPLLDSGGDIAADAYGLAPGARLAYINVGESASWAASLGVFGSGTGANFASGPSRPLVIGQLEWSPLQINGEARGNYRLYAWTNGQTTDLAGSTQRHSGWGVSADQRLGRDWNLFGRWGQRSSGEGAFDKALTLGFEHGGRAWGRGPDALGLAAGWVHTSNALKAGGLSGAEQTVELYYRMKLNDHLELSPDVQFIRRAGGDPAADPITVLGVRASVGF
jgi:high affinity Mn2+ porin